MAYMNSWTNIVGPIYPKNGTSNVPVDTAITVNFLMDMVKESVESSGIVLFDESNTRIPAVIRYENKVATVTPSVPLDPSTRYKLLVCSGATGVKTLTGQILGTDYNINFTTVDIAPPGKVALLAPVDKSIFNGLTEFRWQSITGVTTYEIQISNESTFGSTIYSSLIVGNSIIPDVTFEHDETYYWRVRAVSNAATPLTGAWSDTWQFRYFITNQLGIPVPTTPTTPYTALDVIRVTPGPEEMFVTDLKSITVEFNSDVDPLTINDNNFIVKVDYLDGAGEPVKADGYFDVADNVVEFIFGKDPATTPTSTKTNTVTGIGGTLDVTKNTIITVELRKEISASNSSPLADDITWMFTTVFSPYYSKISDIREELATIAVNVTDLEIAKTVFRVSEWADQIAALPYGSQNENYLGDTQQKTNNCIFYHNYVKYETILRILNNKTLERLQVQSGQKQIGDLIIRDGMYISPDYATTVKKIEALRNRYQMYLTLGTNTYALPVSCVKGETSYPYSLNKRNSF